MSESESEKIVDDTCNCMECVSERRARMDEQVILRQADRLREMRRINGGLAEKNVELIAERDRLAGRVVAVEAENVELRREDGRKQAAIDGLAESRNRLLGEREKLRQERGALGRELPALRDRAAKLEAELAAGKARVEKLFAGDAEFVVRQPGLEKVVKLKDLCDAYARLHRLGEAAAEAGPDYRPCCPKCGRIGVPMYDGTLHCLSCQDAFPGRRPDPKPAGPNEYLGPPKPGAAPVTLKPHVVEILSGDPSCVYSRFVDPKIVQLTF